MEFFDRCETVRLRSHHEKFLLASSDLESVYQDRHGSSKKARWNVEFVQGYDKVIRFKSCYGKYLTASEDQFLLGVTGRKVLQTTPVKLDSSVEWEPVRDGMALRLKTRYGNFLRANGGVPPWRNSITHDIPHRHFSWVLWEVDVVKRIPDSPQKVPRTQSTGSDLSSSSFHLVSDESSKQEVNDGDSAVKSEGRMIYYHIADENGDVDYSFEAAAFCFKGNGLEELTEKLEDETEINNIIVCSRNRIDGKLYPLRLALPPNNATMHIVVVPSNTKGAREFVPGSP